MTNALNVSAPSTGAVNDVLAISGTVSPATDAVVLQLAQQATTAPTGAWTGCFTANGTFNGTLVPPAGGTWYAWAFDQITGLTAVSGPITVPNPAQTLVPAVPLSIQQAQDLLGTGGAGETPDELPAAAFISASDTMLVAQGGKAVLAQPFSVLIAWIFAQLVNFLWPVVEVEGNIALDNSAHNFRVLHVTAAGVTISPSLASMSAGFRCEVINTSGATVALSGMTTNTGATTIAAGGAATVMAFGSTPTVYARL